MPQERRVESHNLINELVNTRNEMLTIFSELIEHRPFEQMDDDLPGLVERFCQALIDYTADAHFRLYRFIDERSERRRSIVNVANQVYPKILDSTQIILDFNDKYETTRSKDELGALSQDLSQLGENLAERIELEDRVIDAFKERRGQG